MAEFYTSIGYAIPFESNQKGHRRIDKNSLRASGFWEDVPERNMRGCYIFSLKRAKGFTPFYVGKAAEQSFESECFTSHKLSDHYNKILFEEIRGLPYLFLVPQMKVGRGKWSTSAIDDLEKHLIAIAAAKNNRLSNQRRLPKDQWSIKGVLASKRGKPSTDAILFKAMMGIK